MLISLFFATALADDVQWILEGELFEPVERVQDDWEIVDLGAAPGGAVVMTLDSSVALPAENTTYALSARENGDIDWRLEIDTYGGALIALDHYEEMKSGGMELQNYVILADQGQILGLVYLPALDNAQLVAFATVPEHIVQSHDIAAGNDHVYVVGSDKGGNVYLLSYDALAQEWTEIHTPFDTVKAGPLPSVDLDRRRDRVALAKGGTLLHYTPDLEPVGQCFLANDPVEPLLGREFAVENGVLVYVNRSVVRYIGGPQDHRMHVADADDCSALDSLWFEASKYGGLNAMSIEPQPKHASPLWFLFDDLEPYVRSWTALDVGETGMFRTDAELRRPWI